SQTIGRPALEVIGQDGFVMTLDLTPNRADLLSVLGFAYDVASMTQQQVKLPKFNVKEEKTPNLVKVDIKTEGCGRYYARSFSSIVIKDSPWWLKSALMASGINPINNVVDISNYVLLEYGTPLHMFDASKVKTNHIVVRDAKKGEKVITLDEIERVLEKDDVVITNNQEVIAIGGVMGLLGTMIDDQTKAVILEAAYFDPKRIRKTSKRLNLRSESSLRFERGIDDERVYFGMERATELLIQLADAKVNQGISEAIHHVVENPVIDIERTYFNDKLGTQIPDETLLAYLKDYAYEIQVSDDVLKVKAPSYRKDIQIKADVLEEVARMHGLDRIPMQALDGHAFGALSDKQKRLRQLRHQLASIGFNEIISYSLLASDDVHRYNNLGHPVSVLTPLSEDKKTLRQSLVHGLLEAISYNQSRQIEGVSVFEIGHVFAKGIEETHLGLAMSGIWQTQTWKKENLMPDFFVLKGLIDQVFHGLGIAFDYVETKGQKVYHPYKQADIIWHHQVIGQIAELHPKEEKRLDVNQTVVATIKLDPLLAVEKKLMFRTPSKYPNISRDLAVVVSEDVKAEALISLIGQTAKDKLVSIKVFDIYQGSHIETGKKSIAFNLVFNDAIKTLQSDDVDQLMEKITNRLSFTHQAEIRR
ncbi:MAG: phenylalanine--tRNA ligase subunit beta, partial [Acholeplasmataceae bacterium]|nr:phenylalanine--tRNA ligase subunit beta [Acholeplasmataceae bacterium]